MKRHTQEIGVRYWAGGDLLELQSESLKVLDGFLSEYGPCVVSGCEIRSQNEDGTYNVGPGIVALRGMDAEGRLVNMVVEFQGVRETLLPLYLVLKFNQQTRAYADGKVKPIANEYYAYATTEKPEVPHLEITANGATHFFDVIQTTNRRFVTDQQIDTWSEPVPQSNTILAVKPYLPCRPAKGDCYMLNLKHPLVEIYGSGVLVETYHFRTFKNYRRCIGDPQAALGHVQGTGSVEMFTPISIPDRINEYSTSTGNNMLIINPNEKFITGYIPVINTNGLLIIKGQMLGGAGQRSLINEIIVDSLDSQLNSISLNELNGGGLHLNTMKAIPLQLSLETRFVQISLRANYSLISSIQFMCLSPSLPMDNNLIYRYNYSGVWETRKVDDNVVHVKGQSWELRRDENNYFKKHIIKQIPKIEFKGVDEKGYLCIKSVDSTNYYVRFFLRRRVRKSAWNNNGFLEKICTRTRYVEKKKQHFYGPNAITRKIAVSGRQLKRTDMLPYSESEIYESVFKKTDGLVAAYKKTNGLGDVLSSRLPVNLTYNYVDIAFCLSVKVNKKFVNGPWTYFVIQNKKVRERR